jgi:hypothetical protein
LEKRRVHAEFERPGAAQPGADAVDQLAPEGDRLLGVVDVPGPVLEAQDVPGLRHVGEQRVVAQMLR